MNGITDPIIPIGVGPDPLYIFILNTPRFEKAEQEFELIEWTWRTPYYYEVMENFFSCKM